MDKIRVLCIDDEAEARKALCSLLRTREYIVTTAASGQSGLAFFKQRKFDVVLCDLNMPKMSGSGSLVSTVCPGPMWLLITSYHLMVLKFFIRSLLITQLKLNLKIRSLQYLKMWPKTYF